MILTATEMIIITILTIIACIIRATIIIDVGINVEMNGEQKRILCGDVNFEEVKGIVSAISPVPGGIGLMTIVALFENLIEAYQKTT